MSSFPAGKNVLIITNVEQDLIVFSVSLSNIDNIYQFSMNKTNKHDSNSQCSELAFVIKNCNRLICISIFLL